MADSHRIEELKRRVQSDPASIAFAALAEEYRRAGQYDEAIATCKTGLRRHPAYLSARVTLGRALIEVGQYDEAREELNYVLKLAPENLAAIRGLGDIQHRLGSGGEPDVPGKAPVPVAAAPAQAAAPPRAPAARTSESTEPAATIPLSRAEASVVQEPAPWDLPTAADAPSPIVAQPPSPVVADNNPALAGLEEFLAAIRRARRELDAGGGGTARY